MPQVQSGPPRTSIVLHLIQSQQSHSGLELPLEALLTRTPFAAFFVLVLRYFHIRHFGEEKLIIKQTNLTKKRKLKIKQTNSTKKRRKDESNVSRGRLFFDPFSIGRYRYDNFDAQEDRAAYSSSAYAYDGATFGTGGMAGGGGGDIPPAPQQADL